MAHGLKYFRLGVGAIVGKLLKLPGKVLGSE